MIDEATLENIQSHRTQQICQWLSNYDCGGIILFDAVNVRYATGSRNMQVWTMHNLCRYALILESGETILFELPGSMHLSKGLSAISELRPALSADYMTVGGRTKEMAKRWTDEMKAILREAGVENEKIAIDRADLEISLACLAAGINLIDGKPVMEHARAIKSEDEIQVLQWSLSTCEERLPI